MLHSKSSRPLPPNCGDWNCKVVSESSVKRWNWLPLESLNDRKIIKRAFVRSPLNCLRHYIWKCTITSSAIICHWQSALRSNRRLNIVDPWPTGAFAWSQTTTQWNRQSSSSTCQSFLFTFYSVFFTNQFQLQKLKFRCETVAIVFCEIHSAATH